MNTAFFGKRLLCSVLLIPLCLVLNAAALHAEPVEAFDHSALDQFIKKFISEKGEFDFESARKDSSLLDAYLAKAQALSVLDIGTNWLREEQLAFWLNIYHAAVFRQILNAPAGFRSLNDIKDMWTYPVVKIGTLGFSINRIRQAQLIQSFHDEKMNAAFACGAKSCPDFPREAFSAQRVEGQLFMAASHFVNDERYVQIDPKAKKVRLSRLFKWYSNDFVLDFGNGTALKFSPPEMAVLSFIRHYLQDAEKIDFLETLNFKIKYLDFDWTLKQTPSEKTAAAAK